MNIKNSTHFRCPLKFNFNTTEEITISQGNRYKLEVQDGFYQLYMWMKDSWFLMYRFERDPTTRGPKASDKETTLELCKMVHESPGFIPIRDKYVKVALQTSDSNLGMHMSLFDATKNRNVISYRTRATTSHSQLVTTPLS